MCLSDFGALGDNSADDYTAVQLAIDAISAQGGGKLLGERNKIYKCNTAPILKDGVVLDLQMSTLRLTLTGTGGADYGLRLRSFASIRNGTVSVETSGTVGSQAGIHAAINIGPLYGDTGTIGSPSPEEGVNNWSILNVTALSDRDGAVAIQVLGGAHNGYINGLTIPDSSELFGAIHMDWGLVGGITASDIAASRTAFDAATAYVTHPHDIVVCNVKVGALTKPNTGPDTGSHVLRLSGVYNIKAFGVAADQCTYAGVRFTAGDLGAEFTPAAEKDLVHKGVEIDLVTVTNTTESWLVLADSYADNIAAAVSGSGYGPIIDPKNKTDILLSRIYGSGDNSGLSAGIRMQQINGGTVKDCMPKKYSDGLILEEGAENVKILGGIYTQNRDSGIYAGHSNAPYRCEIIGARSFANGTDGGSSRPFGVTVGKVAGLTIRDCEIGEDSEATQTRGLVLNDATATGVRIRNNEVRGVKSGGIAYLMLTSTDYGVLEEFSGNKCVSGITAYSGVNIKPESTELSVSGNVGLFTAQKAALSADTTPSAGTWRAGDRIRYLDPSAGGYVGTVCVTAGTPGTWKRYGAIEV